MGLKKCCVPGCKDTKSTRRKFPIYEEEVYNIWLQRIGNSELYCIEPTKLYTRKFICNAHFSHHCQLEGSFRLKYQSLPTINLPGYQGEADLKNSLYPHFCNKMELPAVLSSETLLSESAVRNSPESIIESASIVTDALDTTIKTVDRTSIMADNNGTDLNLLKFHVKEEYSPTNMKVEVYEGIIKTETELSGGSWVYVDIKELLANKNQNLENPDKQLLNENTDIKREEAFGDDSKIWERINNLSTNCQKEKENGQDFNNENINFDKEEKVSQQDPIENMKTNNRVKQEKFKLLHSDDVLALEKRVLLSKKECEKDVVLNCAKGKKQKSECNNYNAIEKKYKCNECSYAAARKQELQFHIKSRHTFEKPYKCVECSYAAVRKQILLLHIKTHHTMEKPYKCNQCSYAATQKVALLSHTKSRHTMERPYKCNECSYTAGRKSNLLSHIKFRHTLEKSYKCKECSYAAVLKRDLLFHIQSHHTMEKPYKCNECSYAAVKKVNLLSHIKFRHTLEKSYKCKECSYAAVLKSDLLFHVQSHHTMEKPYKCNECSYATVKKSNLLSHIKFRHTIEKP